MLASSYPRAELRGARGKVLKPWGEQAARSRARLISNPLKRSVGFRRQLDADGVVGSHLAAGQDHAHDAGFVDETAALVAPQRRHQAGPEAVELRQGLRKPAASTTT